MHSAVFLVLCFFKFSNYVFKFQSNPYQMSLCSWEAMHEDKESGWFQLCSVISCWVWFARGFRWGVHIAQSTHNIKEIISFFPASHKSKVLQTPRDVHSVHNMYFISTRSVTAADQADDGSNSEGVGFIVSLLCINPFSNDRAGSAGEALRENSKRERER